MKCAVVPDRECLPLPSLDSRLSRQEKTFCTIEMRRKRTQADMTATLAASREVASSRSRRCWSRRCGRISVAVASSLLAGSSVSGLMTAPLRKTALRLTAATNTASEGPSTLTAEAPPSTTDLPPWLARLHTHYSEDEIQGHVEWLEYALLEQGFSVDDIQDLLDTMDYAAQGSAARRMGMAEFCRLLLQIDASDPDDTSRGTSGSLLATKDVLVASILHFGDCIAARETGLYDMVKRAIYRDPSTARVGAAMPKYLPAELERRDDRSTANSASRPTQTIRVADTEDILSNTKLLSNSSPLGDDTSNTTALRYDDYGPEALRIARGAARLKRAEILAHAVLGKDRVPSRHESGRIRGLLLTVMEDWRALAIRSVACLYRLEGVLKHELRMQTAQERTPEIVQAAREALKIYAPLAQRLGFHRLKSRLEDRAFRILYRRQYHAVKGLYREKGENMQVVSSFLETQITDILHEHDDLMEELDVLRVKSRVKEPYSLWKKLLRMRSRNPSKSTSSLLHASTTCSLTSSEVSLLDVEDGIALRIVLRARKWTPDETDDATRARERLLCYYVQHLLRGHWPVADPSRIKDYIAWPKKNGYQSLHYTSSITSEGEDWPFEVQVRSEEMHRIAEFGLAAHWNYKLGDKNVPRLSPSVPATVEVVPPYAATEKTPVSPKSSYINSLVTARRNLVQQKVFVFFAGSSAIANKGQLLSLPVGARISDAIVELEAQLQTVLIVNLQENSIVRNGRLADMDEFVMNGDVLLIEV